MSILGDIVKQISGVTYQKSQATTKPSEGCKPVLRAGNISSSRILEEDYVYVPENLVRNDRLLRYGDILIAASSGSLSVVGKAAMLEADMDAGFGAFCKVLRPNTEIVYPRYFRFFFETKYYKNTIQHLAAGANINNLKSEHFHNLEIPLPPLAEQQKIAAILDAADSLRQKDQQLVERYTTLSQSLFLEMFGDPVTNPMVWDKLELGTLAKISSGSTPSRDVAENYHGDIPWVKTGEVNGTDINQTSECISEVALANSSCKLYPSGSLIIAMYGQGKTRGQVGRLKIEAATNQACAVIPPSTKMNYDFLYSLIKLLYEDLRSLGRGGNQPNLNSGLIKTYSVISPPMHLQNQFAESIKLIEAQKQQAQASLQKSEALFNSLLQQAFTGELTANLAA